MKLDFEVGCPVKGLLRKRRVETREYLRLKFSFDVPEIKEGRAVPAFEASGPVARMPVDKLHGRAQHDPTGAIFHDGAFLMPIATSGRGEDLAGKPIEEALSLHLRHSMVSSFWQLPLFRDHEPRHRRERSDFVSISEDHEDLVKETFAGRVRGLAVHKGRLYQRGVIPMYRVTAGHEPRTELISSLFGRNQDRGAFAARFFLPEEREAALAAHADAGGKGEFPTIVPLVDAPMPEAARMGSLHRVVDDVVSALDQANAKDWFTRFGAPDLTDAVMRLVKVVDQGEPAGARAVGHAIEAFATALRARLALAKDDPIEIALRHAEAHLGYLPRAEAGMAPAP